MLIVYNVYLNMQCELTVFHFNVGSLTFYLFKKNRLSEPYMSFYLRTPLDLYAKRDCKPGSFKPYVEKIELNNHN